MNPRRRVGIWVVAPLITAGILLGSVAPASAETDRLSSQCIYVGYVKRACAYYQSVSWGSGISWGAYGQVVDMETADGWTNYIEIKLNRKWSSNTRWLGIASAGDGLRSDYDWISGYDPTYGAWMRLCSLDLSSGGFYCNPSRYVRDNS